MKAEHKKIAIGVGVSLVLIGVAYGVGRVQSAGRIDEAEGRANAAASASVEAVASERARAAIERGRVDRLEGRRRLHLAIAALDERNFGIAQEQLNAATTQFARAGGGDNDLIELAKEIAAYKVSATDDVGEQRKKVLEWARRFDAMMPPEP